MKKNYLKIFSIFLFLLSCYVISFAYDTDIQYKSKLSYFSDSANGDRFEKLGIYYDGVLTKKVDDVILDNKNLLYWQANTSFDTQEKCSSYDNDDFSNTECNNDIKGQCNYCSAKMYCSDLSFGGFDDWRLPGVEELVSIIDYTKNNPDSKNNMVDENKFNLHETGRYWTSTIKKYNNTDVIINFRSGRISESNLSEGARVICVRGGI